MGENITNNEEFNNENLNSKQNLDEIQAMIRQKMSEDSSGIYSDGLENSSENYIVSSDSNTSASRHLKEKKFVVSIKPENLEFFESLPSEKRTEVVNTIISAYRDEQKDDVDTVKTKKFIKHLIVVVLTIAIGFPLVFYITNASIEATVNSYREVQNNFEKLYQQKGGVKRKDLSKLQNLQY